MIQSAEKLLQNDDDMMFRDAFYDFLKKIYMKQFLSSDFKHYGGDNTEQFKEVKAKLSMLAARIKIT